MSRTRAFVPAALRARAFTLAEMLVAMGIFGLATLGMWETIRTVFFLSAKNTGLNLSHAALHDDVDQVAEQLRGSLQVVDVATFDGTKFTHVDETAATGTSAAGNAVRFVRLLPITLYLVPDGSGVTYSMSNPENPASLLYPDYLLPGNKTVKGTYTLTSNQTLAAMATDLTASRLLPRFPYLTEPITSGSDLGTMPGLDLVSAPAFNGSNFTITLNSGLPATPKVPSCNQAYLVVVSAYAVLNRGTTNAELMYYPDAGTLTSGVSLSTAIAASTSGNGPTVFALPKTAGALNDPTARASLQINMPVVAPNLANTVVRRGGTAALTYVKLSLPVEVRRRAQF